MKLYDNAFSPNAKRAKVIANELGINLELVPMDFAKGDLRTPEYLAKNPMGKVPTLQEDDGWVLWESPAILLYLALKHPDKGLVPSEPRATAEIARWMFWNASHLEASVFRIGFEKVVKPMMGQKPDEAVIAEGTSWWQRFAPVLNGHLEGKTWILGNQFSIADIALGTTIEFGRFVGIDVAPFKHLTAWHDRLTARESWKKASGK